MSLNPSAVGWKSESTTFNYDWKTLVLYALGIGAKAPELDYLYEGRGPKTFCTFAVVPAIEHVFACLKPAGIKLSSVVHGGQTIRALQPLPPSGSLSTYAEIAGLYDLKRFAQIIIRAESSLDGSPIFETTWSIIIRDEGGFGGPTPPKIPSVSIPKGTTPDMVDEERTSPEQGLIYRLSGDVNPLHVDPEAARAAGFERGPILHGLATFGFATRAIVRNACEGDAARIETIHGQFRKPVWPGDTLVTEGWRTEGKVAFQVSVKEREEIVLGSGWAQLR